MMVITLLGETLPVAIVGNDRWWRWWGRFAWIVRLAVEDVVRKIWRVATARAPFSVCTQAGLPGRLQKFGLPHRPLWAHIDHLRLGGRFMRWSRGGSW